MMPGSTSAFIFIQIAAGRPALACAISCAMWSRMRLRSMIGEIAIASSSPGSA